MNLLDIRTIVFSYVITNAICLAVMTFLWLRNRHRFAGLGFWLADFVIQFIVIVLIVLRGIVPDFLSIVASNTLVMGGTILLYIGLERFVGKRTSQVHNYLFLAVFIFIHSYFTFVQPSLLIRTINLSVGIIFLCSQCAWLLIYRADAHMRPITRAVGYVFLAFCIFSLIRILLVLVVDPGNDFFTSGIWEALAVLINQMLFMILTFGLLLMVNRRLVLDLERDILQREQVEGALRLSEEKFYKAFHSSPDAILITRVHDGKLVEVNEGFFRLSGYSRQEALASSSINLGLWVNPQDREEGLAALKENRSIRDREYNFRIKSGRILKCLYSGQIIQLEGEAHVLSVVRDITERKRAEEDLQRSKALLLQTGQMAKVGGWELDLQTMTPYWSPEAYRIHEMDPSLQPNLENAINFYTPEARSIIREAVQQAIEAGQAYDLELPVITAKGKPTWVRTIGQPEFQDGRCVRLFGTFQDITERKQKDEILRHRTNVLAALHQVVLDLVNRHEMDEILQTLLGNIDVLLDVSDVSIDLVENNDTLVTYAATPDQPLVKGDTMRRGEGGWLSWQAVETGQAAILEDYSAWSQRRELYESFPIHAIAIIPIHHRDHVIGTINFSRREPNKPFNETDIYVAEQLAEMVALVLDNAQLYTQLQSELAERKRIEENLRESRENFQRYFNVSTVGMCVTAPDRHWIETNGRLRQMLGYSAEELDNLTWSEITHPDDLDADLALFNQLLANERDSYQLDKRFVRKDGAIVYTTIFVSCYRNPNGSVRYCLAALVDITDRTLARESLLKLAAIEERQRLARDLHDSVNQSIHGLVLFSETLVSTLEKNNTNRARQIADRLQESARQALKETRLMLYEMQTTDPERSVNLIQDLEMRLVTVERRAGVKAQIVQQGSIDLCPQAWHENLFWITIEALNNALKHAQARNMQIKICCSPKRVELEIVDDGIGFDPHKPRAGGLGLHNMRDRANLIGGELTILSTLKKGSCVRVSAEIKE